MRELFKHISLLMLSYLAGSATAQIRVSPLTGLESGADNPSLSPDGKILAFDWCTPNYRCGIYTRSYTGGDIKLLVDKDEKDGTPVEPRWSPDGKSVSFSRFYSRFDKSLRIRDIASGVEHDLGLSCGALGSSWSPDGRFLAASAYAGDPSVTNACQPALYSAENGKRVRILAPRGSNPAFSPDGRAIAYADGKSLMLLRLTVDFRPIGRATVLARESRGISEIAWTRDGKQLFYEIWSEGRSEIRRIALGSRTTPSGVLGLSAQISGIELLADGSALATETTQTAALWRADLGTRPLEMKVVPDDECAPSMPGCSPDGRRRVYPSMRNGVSQIWISNADGTNARALVRSIPEVPGQSDEGVPGLIGWSPDGKWIAFIVFAVHGNADIWSYLYVVPPGGGSPRRLAESAYAIDNPSWSVDSKSLYGTQGWPADDREHSLKWPIVRIDVEDGKATPLGIDGMWPKMSPDGEWLYFFTSPRPELSRARIAGGHAEPLGNQGRFGWFNYAVGARYLYLFQMAPRGAKASEPETLVRLDPTSKQFEELAKIPFQPRSAYLSPDARFLYFGQRDEPKRRIVVVHGLR